MCNDEKYMDAEQMEGCIEDGLTVRWAVGFGNKWTETKKEMNKLSFPVDFGISYILRLVTCLSIMGTGKARRSTPIKAQAAPRSFPLTVQGTISP